MHLRLLATLPLVLVAASCGPMSSLKDNTLAGVDKMGEGIDKGFGAMANLATAPFKPGVPVVEARENEWKQQQSGQEQALAFQEKQRQRRSFWNFGGAIDFEEPELPEIGSEPATASLLPPKD